MLTQEQKLNKFLTAIDEYAEKERARILSELESGNRIAIEKAEKATLENAYNIINRRTADVRMQISRKSAMRETEAKNDLIRKRCEIEAEVFKKAAERLSEYIKTAAYRELLMQTATNAAEVLSEGDTVIYMRGDDIPLKEDIVRAFGKSCTVCVDDGIVIGGIRFENEAMSRAIDASFDSELDSQRDEFAKNSGLRILY